MHIPVNLYLAAVTRRHAIAVPCAHNTGAAAYLESAAGHACGAVRLGIA